MTDDFARALNFTYDAANRVTSMVDPAGGTYTYAYDSANNLTSVTYPDTTARGYIYNEAVYTANTNLPNALTGIVDENGTRFAIFKYDTRGWASSTEWCRPR